MPYRVINIYYSVTCYTNHINSTRIQSIASMALKVFPDVSDGCANRWMGMWMGMHVDGLDGHVWACMRMDVRVGMDVSEWAYVSKGKFTCKLTIAIIVVGGCGGKLSTCV